MLRVAWLTTPKKSKYKKHGEKKKVIPNHAIRKVRNPAAIAEYPIPVKQVLLILL